MSANDLCGAGVIMIKLGSDPKQGFIGLLLKRDAGFETGMDEYIFFVVDKHLMVKRTLLNKFKTSFERVGFPLEPDIEFAFGE